MPRLFVGIGEATLHPSAAKAFSQLFSKDQRATIFSLFFLGGHIGIGLAYWLAGTLGEALGWRQLFFYLGLAGMALCLLLLISVTPILRSKGRDTQHAEHQLTPLMTSFKKLEHALRSSVRFRVVIVGFALVHMLYASNQFMQIWLASERGFNDYAASSLFGSIYLSVAIPSGLLGGIAADAFAKHFNSTKYAFLVIVFTLTAPLLFGLRLASPSSVFFDIGLLASAFLLTFPYGAMFSAVLDEAPEDIQSTATGFTMFACNVLVIGGGTWMIGALADFLSSQNHAQPLTSTLLLADAITLLSILCFAWLHRHQKAHAST